MNFSKFVINFFVIFLFVSQFSWAQTKTNDDLYIEAVDDFKYGNFSNAKASIYKIRKNSKTLPLKVKILELRINYEILKLDPLSDFDIIIESKKTAKELINKPSKNKDTNEEVKEINNFLNTLPKTKTEFDFEIKTLKEREERARIEAEKQKKIQEEKRIQEEIDRKAKKEEDARKYEEWRIKEIENSKIREEQRIKDLAYQKKIDEQNQQRIKEQQTVDEKRQNEYASNSSKEYKKQLLKTQSFSSLVLEGGEIAHYGLAYETGGGKNFIGLKIGIRSTIANTADIMSGKIIKNKNEIEIGPNFKIFRRFIINTCVGYGYFDYLNRNDFGGTPTVEKQTYISGSTGFTFRLSRVIGLTGGLSFIDVDKDFYKPEYKIGIAFNLKGKYKN